MVGIGNKLFCSLRPQPGPFDILFTVAASIVTVVGRMDEREATTMLGDFAHLGNGLKDLDSFHAQYYYWTAATERTKKKPAFAGSFEALCFTANLHLPRRNKRNLR